MLFAEKHYSANELFGIIISILVVVFVSHHAHRLHETLAQMFDETRFRAGHVGDERLKDPLVGQYTPLESGCLGRICMCHGLFRLSYVEWMTNKERAR